MARESLNVSVSADETDLRAKLALAQADVRRFGGAVRKTSDEIGRSGMGSALAADLGKSAGALRGAEKRVASLRSALAEGAQEFNNWSQVGRHAVAMVDESMRHARGQFVASTIAMARDSGVLGRAIEVLKTPIGGVGLAFVGLGATIAAVIAGAILEVRSLNAELAAAGRQALVMGENPAAGAERYKALRGALVGAGIAPGEAPGVALALAGARNLGAADREALARVAPAMLRAQFGGNADAMGKSIAQMFGSPQAMRKLVEENDLLGGAQLQSFLRASASGQSRRAAHLLAQGLTTRYGPYAAALKAVGQREISETEAAAPYGGISGTAARGMLGPNPVVPPAPLRMPSRAEVEAGKFAFEALQKTGVYQIEELKRERTAIEAQVKSGGMPAATGAEAVKQIGREIDALQVKLAKVPKAAKIPKTPGASTALEEIRLREARAMAAPALAGDRMGQLRADLGALADGLKRGNLSAAQRIEVETQLAQKERQLGDAVAQAVAKSGGLVGEKNSFFAPELEAMKAEAKAGAEYLNAAATALKEAAAQQKEAAAKAASSINSALDHIGTDFRSAIDKLLFEIPYEQKQLVSSQSVGPNGLPVTSTQVVNQTPSVLRALGVSIEKDLANSVLNGLGKGFMSMIGAGGKYGLAGLLGVGSQGGLFGTGLGAVSGVSQTAILTTHTGLLSLIASNTGATAAEIAATGAANAGTSGLSAAGSVGGIFSGIAKIGGFIGSLLFPPAAPVLTPLTMMTNPFAFLGGSRGMIVPAAAQGWSLPGFGSDTVPAMLTPGETVLPVGERPSAIAAHLGAMLEGSGGKTAGDVHMHFHGPADGDSISRFIAGIVGDNPEPFLRAVRGAAFRFA